ncbi:DUF4097 family beta strand repeat-containing protein [Serinicoccus kebangsaanensis]|uniref:DUF4097 family beta strand repeat-containing protein n=1 Tax=Serinicoccus kebangsaanensis TaxID=2602069 RepID=UPI00124D0A60|nr:DUF4097 family beta strand repeat-containing protein [Serinicoccus kebangsaanensis]
MDTTTQTTHTYTFTEDDLVALEVKNHSGDIATFFDAPDGTAEVTLSCPRPVDFEPVTAVSQRGRVLVDIPALIGPDGGGRGFSLSIGAFSIGTGHEPVHVEVHLPRGTELKASTKNGDVVLQGVGGTAAVRSGSGDLSIEEVGALRAATGSGDVRVGQLAAGSVTSGSGDIVVDRSTGPDPLEVRSGSGDISIAESHQDTTIATGSGDVEVGHARGELAVRTGTGDVQVRVPRGIPVWLDLSSGIGEVRRDIDGVGAPEDDQDFLRVSVRTGTGDIAVQH